MNEEPPPPAPPPPDAKPTKSEITLRAFAGFGIYVMVGVLALMTLPAGLFFLALPIIFAVYTAITGKIRGFALGVFIGAGFTLLAAGLCFVAFA